jgi:hypothetical protein
MDQCTTAKTKQNDCHRVRVTYTNYSGLSDVKNLSYEEKTFWDVVPCGFIINRRLGGTCRVHLQDGRNSESEEKC